MKNHFRKICLIAFVLFFSYLLTGCNIISNMELHYNNSRLQLAKETAQDIIDTFIDEDEDALYSLFSQAAKKDYPRMREQIQEAFEFIDGKIISYELPTSTGGGGRVAENGKITSEDISPDFSIETESGKKYNMSFQYFLVFEYDKDAEGMEMIIIDLVSESGALVERMAIGPELQPRNIIS